MPRAAIGPVQLDVHDVVVALPCLVEHEAVLGFRIPMEDRLAEIRLLAHGIEHAFQKLEELVAPFGHNLEFDEIGDWHESPPCREVAARPRSSGRWALRR